MELACRSYTVPASRPSAMWTPPSPPFVCTYGRPVPVYVCCVFDIKTTDTAPSQLKNFFAHGRRTVHKHKLPGFLLHLFGFLLHVFASGVSASPWRAASRSSWPCDAAPNRDAVQERRRRAVLRLRCNREHALVLRVRSAARIRSRIGAGSAMASSCSMAA